MGRTPAQRERRETSRSELREVRHQFRESWQDSRRIREEQRKEEAGKGALHRIGVALTMWITLPLLSLTIFGTPGFIVALVVALLWSVSRRL